MGLYVAVCFTLFILYQYVVVVLVGHDAARKSPHGLLHHILRRLAEDASYALHFCFLLYSRHIRLLRLFRCLLRYQRVYLGARRAVADGGVDVLPNISACRPALASAIL